MPNENQPPTIHETVLVNRCEIVVESDFNVRADRLQREVIDRYRDNFFALPPVEVYWVEQRFVLVDGWHRMAAASELNLVEIPVLVVGSGTMQEAQTHALLANLKHGLPLTVSQRKEVARRLQDATKWTERKIAEALGIARSTAHEWLTDRCSTNEQKNDSPVVTLDKVLVDFNRFKSSSLPLEDWSREQKQFALGQLRPVVKFIADIEASL